MIISRTPFRISFMGGGTDYPAWYREHGGRVLATSIDKYCYLTLRYLPPFFEHRYRVVYSKVEETQHASELRHPVVRAMFEDMKVERGIELHHDGDLPARSGMGSSSSFTVGLLHALHALNGKMCSKMELALGAIRVEQELLNENVGSQDQVSAAFGGLNLINFQRSGEISVQPVTLADERQRAFNDHFMLFFTGIRRISSDVVGTYIKDLESKKRNLRIMNDFVDEALTILTGEGDLKAFGDLLHEAWQIKQGMSQAVSNDEISQIYDAARSAGAWGGKLIGAGGGGFMLLFVPPEKQKTVRKTLENLIYVPFEFENSGSQIVFYDPEQDYSDIEKVRFANGH